MYAQYIEPHNQDDLRIEPVKVVCFVGSPNTDCEKVYRVIQYRNSWDWEIVVLLYREAWSCY